MADSKSLQRLQEAVADVRDLLITVDANLETARHGNLFAMLSHEFELRLRNYEKIVRLDENMRFTTNEHLL